MIDDYIILSRSVCEWVQAARTVKEFVLRFEQVCEYEFNGIEPTIDIPKPIRKAIEEDIKEKQFRERKDKRHTADYRHWRESVFNRDGFTCQICGQVGGTLNAHHIKQFAYYPDLRYDPKNGVTLCKRCHIEVHRAMRRKGTG